MNIYISGPITGRSKLDCSIAFTMAEANIGYLGHEAINPWKVSALLPVLDHEQYMNIDLEIIKNAADAVYFMEGWKASEGCNIEYEFCQVNGIPIYEKISEVPIV